MFITDHLKTLSAFINVFNNNNLLDPIWLNLMECWYMFQLVKYQILELLEHSMYMV